MSKSVVVVCSVRPEFNVPLRMAFAQLEVDIVDVASIDEALIVVEEHENVRCMLIDQCDFDDEARLISANVLAENNEIAVLFLGVKGASVDSMASALEAGGAGYFRLPIDVGKVVDKLSSYLGCDLPDLVGASLPGYALLPSEDLPEPPPLADDDRPAFAAFATITTDLTEDAEEAGAGSDFSMSPQGSFLNEPPDLDFDAELTQETRPGELGRTTADATLPTGEALTESALVDSEEGGTTAARSVKNRVARLRRSREKSVKKRPDSTTDFDVAKNQVFSAVDQKRLLEENREESASLGLANMLAAFSDDDGQTGSTPLEEISVEEESALPATLSAEPEEVKVPERAGASQRDDAEERVLHEKAEYEERQARAEESAKQTQAQTLEEEGAPSKEIAESQELERNDVENLLQEVRESAERAELENAEIGQIDDENERFLIEEEDRALTKATLEAKQEVEHQKAIAKAKEESRKAAKEELEALRSKKNQERLQLIENEKIEDMRRQREAAERIEQEKEKANSRAKDLLEAALQEEEKKGDAAFDALKEQFAARRAKEESALEKAVQDAREEIQVAHNATQQKAIDDEKRRQALLEQSVLEKEDVKLVALREKHQETLDRERLRISKELAAERTQHLEEERERFEKLAQRREDDQENELAALRKETEEQHDENVLRIRREVSAKLKDTSEDELRILREEFRSRETVREENFNDAIAEEQIRARTRYEEMLRQARNEASEIAKVQTEEKLQAEIAEMARREALEQRKHDDTIELFRQEEEERLAKAQEEAQQYAREQAESTVQSEIARLKEVELDTRQRREEEFERSRLEMAAQQRSQLEEIRREAQTRIQQETQALLQSEFEERQRKMEDETRESRKHFEQEQQETLQLEEEKFLDSLEDTRRQAAENIERSYQELHRKLEEERREKQDALLAERAEEETLRKEVQAQILKEAAENAQRKAAVVAKKEIEAELDRREERRERLRAELSFRQGIFSGDPQEPGLALILSEVGGDPWIETHALLVGEQTFLPGGDEELDPGEIDGPTIALEPLSGVFGDGEVLALLFSAHRLRITGAIDIVHEDGRSRTLFFEEGEPTGFDSQLQGDRACEHLLRAGLITSSRYAEMRAGPGLSARRACSTLVDDGGLLPTELFTAVRGILTEQIMSVAAWDRGTFHYRDDQAHEADRVRLQHSFDVLLAEACRRKFDEERLWRVLGSPSTIIAPNEAVLRMPPLSQKEQRAARLLDGQRALDDVVLETGGGPEIALSTALLLVSCGACRVAAKGLPKVEEEYAATHTSLERERVEDRLQLCRHGDYFTVLGVDREATTFEIRSAATRLRNRFAPERFSSPSLSDLNRAVHEIRDIIAEAEDVLSDDELRSAYRRNTFVAH
ncbi:MAG: hypothetical protein GY822_23385 [Deltaproteobacteria bacterium]|nr:hypothetical protein [Deltaproteobacteria bacterium]